MGKKSSKKAEIKPMGLTDRVAYLRGLADGMNIDESKNENSLILKMLDVMDDMAKRIAELDSELADVEEYVEDIDMDLADMEEVLFGDEDDDCCCDDDDDEDFEEDEDFDEYEGLSFDCPSCGKTVMIKAADIDFDESPVCEFCGKPFFTDAEADAEDSDGE